MANGVDVGIDRLIDSVDNLSIVGAIDTLIKYSTQANLGRLVQKLDDDFFEKVMPKLIKYGVDEKVILSRIKLMRKPKSKPKPKTN